MGFGREDVVHPKKKREWGWDSREMKPTHTKKTKKKLDESKTLPHINTKHQSAFTKDHLISNNIITAFESLHSMHNHKSTKEGYMAIKLDMSKAYDRVEWSFLECMMKKLGFNERWITLMMLCVSSVSYSILINGAPQGFIRPFRRIKQWDPLSPFFISLMHRRAPWFTHPISL